MELSIDDIRTDGGTQPRAQSRRLRRMAIQAGHRECYVCRFDYAPVLHAHHIRPLSEGGSDDGRNLVLLCPTCHALAHKMISLGEYSTDQTSDQKKWRRHFDRFMEFYNWLQENATPEALDRLIQLKDMRHKELAR